MKSLVRSRWTWLGFGLVAALGLSRWLSQES